MAPLRSESSDEPRQAGDAGLSPAQLRKKAMGEIEAVFADALAFATAKPRATPSRDLRQGRGAGRQRAAADAAAASRLRRCRDLRLIRGEVLAGPLDVLAKIAEKECDDGVGTARHAGALVEGLESALTQVRRAFAEIAAFEPDRYQPKSVSEFKRVRSFGVSDQAEMAELRLRAGHGARQLLDQLQPQALGLRAEALLLRRPDPDRFRDARRSMSAARTARRRAAMPVITSSTRWPVSSAPTAPTSSTTRARPTSSSTTSPTRTALFTRRCGSRQTRRSRPGTSATSARPDGRATTATAPRWPTCRASCARRPR